MTLRWLHEADGVADPKAVELKVFALQMVYVPQCAFWVGDGSTTVVAGQFSAGDTAEPFRIESEDAITLGGESKKNLGNRDGLGMRRAEDFTSGGTQTLPARFPKGYAAFYCMRHEITEGEYVGVPQHGQLRAAGRVCAPIEVREGPPHDRDSRLRFPAKARQPAGGVRERHAPRGVPLFDVERLHGVRGLGGTAADDGTGVREGLPRTAAARAGRIRLGDGRDRRHDPTRWHE